MRPVAALVALLLWMNGRPAIPDDPEYFCSGCNLQTLCLLRLLAGADG